MAQALWVAEASPEEIAFPVRTLDWRDKSFDAECICDPVGAPHRSMEEIPTNPMCPWAGHRPGTWARDSRGFPSYMTE